MNPEAPAAFHDGSMMLHGRVWCKMRATPLSSNSHSQAPVLAHKRFRLVTYVAGSATACVLIMPSLLIQVHMERELDEATASREDTVSMEAGIGRLGFVALTGNVQDPVQQPARGP